MDYIKASKILAPQSLLNLRKLLEGLKNKKDLKVTFNMEEWATSDSILAPRPNEVKNECGTVCCLAGHGPLLGISSNKGETWPDYVKRVFLEAKQKPNPTSKVDDVHTSFIFLFNSAWGYTEMNTLDHALFRLELFLEKGLPENFSWRIHVNRGPFPYDEFTEEYKLGLHTLT